MICLEYDLTINIQSILHKSTKVIISWDNIN